MEMERMDLRSRKSQGLRQDERDKLRKADGRSSARCSDRGRSIGTAVTGFGSGAENGRNGSKHEEGEEDASG